MESNEEEVFGQQSNYNPFEEDVVEREYTNRSAGGSDDDVDDSSHESVDDGVEDAEYVASNDADDIPEPTYSSHAENLDIEDESTGDESEEGADNSAFTDNTKDMSEKQKRKAASVAADAILTAYRRYVPQPFKKWGKLNEAELDRLQLEKTIDMSIVLDVDGQDLTIREFVESFNLSVDQVMEMSEDQIKDIREPLIDVLMEQGISLTPTQRLLLAVGMHLVGLTTAAFQFSRSSKAYMEVFKDKKAAVGGGSGNIPSYMDDVSLASPEQVKNKIVSTDDDDVADEVFTSDAEVVFEEA